MKKLLELFTISSLALAIAACGNGEEETDTGDETATEETETTEESEGDTASEEEAGSETESEDSATEEESGTESEDGTEGEDAASGEEQSKTFVMEEEGYINELVYYYIDDEVQRQTSQSDITYEALGVEGEEQARELLEQEAANYQEVDGVEQNIEYGEEGIVETLEVDYTVADLSEVSGLEGAEFEEGADEAQFISMERSEEQLLNSGYELADGEE